MITHTSQITFNDVIQVDSQQEYDDVLEIIIKSGENFVLTKGYKAEWKNFFFRSCLGSNKRSIKDGHRFMGNDTITPASYFISHNAGLLAGKNIL